MLVVYSIHTYVYTHREYERTILFINLFLSFLIVLIAVLIATVEFLSRRCISIYNIYRILWGDSVFLIWTEYFQRNVDYIYMNRRYYRYGIHNYRKVIFFKKKLFRSTLHFIFQFILYSFIDGIFVYDLYRFKYQIHPDIRLSFFKR